MPQSSHNRDKIAYNLFQARDKSIDTASPIPAFGPLLIERRDEY